MSDTATKPKGRENAREKGIRYLTEGRLRVLYIRPSKPEIRATCRGQGETWKLGYKRPPVGWFCDCPAKTTCSHITALQLVVDAPDVPVPF